MTEAKKKLNKKCKKKQKKGDSRGDLITSNCAFYLSVNMGMAHMANMWGFVGA